MSPMFSKVLRELAAVALMLLAKELARRVRRA